MAAENYTILLLFTINQFSQLPQHIDVSWTCCVALIIVIVNHVTMADVSVSNNTCFHLKKENVHKPSVSIFFEHRKDYSIKIIFNDT